MFRRDSFILIGHVKSIQTEYQEEGKEWEAGSFSEEAGGFIYDSSRPGRQLDRTIFFKQLILIRLWSSVAIIAASSQYPSSYQPKSQEGLTIFVIPLSWAVIVSCPDHGVRLIVSQSSYSGQTLYQSVFKVTMICWVAS